MFNNFDSSDIFYFLLRGREIDTIIWDTPVYFAPPVPQYSSPSAPFAQGSQSVLVDPLHTAFSVLLFLSSLDGGTGFKINGESTSDKVGHSVFFGDINGDGIDDVIIGALHAGDIGNINSNFGATYVVFGKAEGWTAEIDLSALDGVNGFKIRGVSSGDLSGSFVSSSDVNGDGIADVIIGSEFGGASGKGKVHVVYGKRTGDAGVADFSALIELSSLGAAEGFTLHGDINDYAGGSLASGDINGDRKADIFVGTSNQVAYVVFGRETTSPFASVEELSALDGSDGFAIRGFETSGYAIAVASLGDIDGDGFADMAVGDFKVTVGEGASAITGAGRVYVIYGKAEAFSAEIFLSNLRAGDGFVLQGGAEYGGSGVLLFRV